MTYTAPARYAVKTLHRKDPSGASDLRADDPVEGHTRCGLPMKASEIWLPTEAQEGEYICTGCMLPGSLAPEPATAEVLF